MIGRVLQVVGQVLTITLAMAGLVCLFTGCATTWVHPTASAEQQRRDEYECGRERVALEQGVTPDYVGIAKAFQAKSVWKMCMEDRGYKAK